MKKIVGSTGLALAVLLMSSCTSGEENAETDQTEQTEAEQAAADTSEESEEQAGADESNESENTGEQTGSDTENQSIGDHPNDEADYQELAPLLADTEEVLGTALPLTEDTYLPHQEGTYYSAAVDTDESRVVIFQTNEAVSINDEGLNDLSQDAKLLTIQKQSYDTEQEAEDAIGYQDITQENTELGYGIEALGEGATGSQYLSWNEGRWYFEMRALTSQEIDLEPDAKYIVAFLEENTLPVPDQYGKIAIDYTEDETTPNHTIQWADGTDVYTITKTTDDTVDLLRTVTTLAE